MRQNTSSRQLQIGTKAGLSNPFDTGRGADNIAYLVGTAGGPNADANRVTATMQVDGELRQAPFDAGLVIGVDNRLVSDAFRILCHDVHLEPKL